MRNKWDKVIKYIGKTPGNKYMAFQEEAADEHFRREL